MHSVKRLGQGHLVQDFDCLFAERQVRPDVFEGFGAIGMPVIKPAGQALLGRGSAHLNQIFQQIITKSIF